jgi:hypothetical protein
MPVSDLTYGGVCRYKKHQDYLNESCRHRYNDHFISKQFAFNLQAHSFPILYSLSEIVRAVGGTLSTKQISP